MTQCIMCGEPCTADLCHKCASCYADAGDLDKVIIALNEEREANGLRPITIELSCAGVWDTAVHYDAPANEDTQPSSPVTSKRAAEVVSETWVQYPRKGGDDAS